MWTGTCWRTVRIVILGIIFIFLVACCARSVWVTLFCCLWWRLLGGWECLMLRGFGGGSVMELSRFILLSRLGSLSLLSRCYCLYYDGLSAFIPCVMSTPLPIICLLLYSVECSEARVVWHIQSWQFCGWVTWTCCITYRWTWVSFIAWYSFIGFSLASLWVGAI